MNDGCRATKVTGIYRSERAELRREDPSRRDLYLRLNNTTDYLISSVANVADTKVFANTALGIVAGAGAYVEFKLVCPAWVTLPTLVRLDGWVYID